MNDGLMNNINSFATGVTKEDVYVYESEIKRLLSDKHDFENEVKEMDKEIMSLKYKLEILQTEKEKMYTGMNEIEHIFTLVLLFVFHNS